AEAMARGLTNQIEAWRKQAGKASASAGHEIFWGLVAYGLVMALLAVRYLPRILAARDAPTQARLAAAVAAAQVVPSMAAEERAFNDFATEFLTRPLAPAPAAPSAPAAPVVRERVVRPQPAPAQADPLQEFFAGAPKTLAAFRD